MDKLSRVSADVMWRLPARGGARGRLWLPSGRHQTGDSALGSTGQTSLILEGGALCWWLLWVNTWTVFQTCCGCKKKGACVGCNVRSCRKTVHFPCGRKQQFVSQFTGLFPWAWTLKPQNCDLLTCTCSSLTSLFPGPIVRTTVPHRPCPWPRSPVCLSPAPSAWTPSTPSSVTPSSNVPPVTAAGSTESVCR